MNIPPTFAAETALLRQNIALSVIKQSADQAKALVNILDQAAQNAPVNKSRGTNLNRQV